MLGLRYRTNIPASNSSSDESLVIGGQLSFYAMHQYYLTQNSIYLVCFDLEKEETLSRLDYWIKTIKDVTTSAPILVVSL